MTPATSGPTPQFLQDRSAPRHEHHSGISGNISLTGNRARCALAARTAGRRYEYACAHRTAPLSAFQGAIAHSPGRTALAPPGARVAVSFQLQRPMAWSHGDND